MQKNINKKFNDQTNKFILDMQVVFILNHVVYEEYMAYIIISLCNQFAVSAIYSFFDGDLLENINTEFDTRMFYLYITMYDYLCKEQILSDDVKYSELYQSLYDNWNRKVFEPIIMLCNQEMDNRMEISIGL